MAAKLTPFNILFDMNKHKIYTKEQVQESGLNSYLLLQFIRSHPLLINIASYINQNWKMPIYDQYLFVLLTFKRFNIKGVSWVKSNKLSKPEDVEMLQRYYNVPYMTASRYLQELPKQKIKEIKEYYDKGGIKR
jgi:hypothetical protein